MLVFFTYKILIRKKYQVDSYIKKMLMQLVSFGSGIDGQLSAMSCWAEMSGADEIAMELAAEIWHAD